MDNVLVGPGVVGPQHFSSRSAPKLFSFHVVWSQESEYFMRNILARPSQNLPCIIQLVYESDESSGFVMVLVLCIEQTINTVRVQKSIDGGDIYTEVYKFKSA